MHVIALGFHFLEYPIDRAEDIEVCGGANVALVGGEAEHRDRKLLLGAGLQSQRCPANRPFSDGLNPVLEGVGLTGGIVPARQHDRLNGAIEFGDGDLQGHLDRVQT